MVDGKTPTVSDKNEPLAPVIKKPGAVEIGAAPGKLLSPAAKRALQEAAARREAAQAATIGANKASLSKSPDEISGPKGVEPTRYGDWERGGIAYDF